MTSVDSTESSVLKLRLEATRLRHGLMADNTLMGYRYDARMYSAWCEHFHREALPTSPETLSLYVTDLLSQGKKITTARRRTCAVAYNHRCHGLASPVTTEVQEVLNGAQRIRAEKPRQMRPLTVKQLRQISAQLARVGTPRSMRNRALLVVGFASALRRSNLGDLNLADVEFVRQGVILHINREKQDQEGRGRSIGLPWGRHPNTCPVRVLRAWLRIRGKEPGPLFPRLNPARKGQALNGECICRIVKQAARGIGLDPTDIGGHSLRAGFITAAGEAGAGELLIASQSGHRNMEILRRYFRRTNLFRSNACAMVGL